MLNLNYNKMKRNRKHALLPVTLAIILLLVYACSERHTNQPLDNTLPETHLSIVLPDSVLPDTSTSMQIPHWWGSDPDGEVMGYLVRWDYFADQPGYGEWFWTVDESDTFFVPIRTPDSSFSIEVRAVDNSAIWNYPDGISINIFDNELFFDNGLVPGYYDPQDSLISEGNRLGNQIDSLFYSPDSIFWTQEESPLLLHEVDIEHLRQNTPVEGPIPIPTDYSNSVDLSPAAMTFPVENSLPTVAFKYGSNPDGEPQDTAFTFNHRTFIWEAQDLDGLSTITYHFWALDDTTVWDSIPGTISSLTLHSEFAGFDEGAHVFYLKTKDIAGAFSPIIQFPDTSDQFQPGVWYVQEPLGDVLLIDDDVFHETVLTDSTRIFYQNTLAQLVGSEYSVWDIEKGLPYSETDLLGTMALFSKVIWFADASSQLADAANSITAYIHSGGHLIISTSDLGEGNGYDNPPFQFLGIDSVSYDIWRFWPGDSLVAQIGNYPDLKLSGLGAITHLENPYGFGFMPADTVEVIYKGYSQYTPGDPNLALRWPANDNPNLIYVDMYLYRANGYGNIIDFFDFVLNEQFEP